MERWGRHGTVSEHMTRERERERKIEEKNIVYRRGSLGYSGKYRKRTIRERYV